MKAELAITRAEGEEITTVMDFIGEYWRADHVLATHRNLMDWQHGNADGSYHYLIARSGEVIEGVLGYIPISRYDAALAANEMIWLALWKIRPECKIAGLGLKMLGALQQLYQNAAFGVNGINHTHPPMYRALGYQSTELRQYYITNPTLPRTLMQAPDSPPTPGSAPIREIHVADIAALSVPLSTQPAKTPTHFLNRFLQHPFYQYRVWLINDALLMATRLVSHNGAQVLRIVDMSGDVAQLAGSGNVWAQLLRETNAEYADFWQHGVDAALLSAAGFRAVDAAAGDVVPNYFEPYRASTERILCVMKSTHAAPWLICRADGDQDRPNQLP